MDKEYGMVKRILVYGTDSDTFKLWMDIMDTAIQKDINPHQVVEAVCKLTAQIFTYNIGASMSTFLGCGQTWHSLDAEGNYEYTE